MEHQAIRNVHSNVRKIVGDSQAWDKDGNEVVLDQPAIAIEFTRLQVAYDDLAYSRARQADYPDWGSQLNKIYDDGVTKWKSEMVDPVKAKWPKDNSGPK